ncbi:MAG: 1,4-dihydroxy-2-naphthoate polyprenyltransferase [Verrucomicrobiota bacterium]|nr:1,4-dihydroxy-2-naphthoate polyprenyltransferase [Verrucomicrobiota bacterium]
MQEDSQLKIWIAAARPRTLPAAIAPVFVGSALAWREGEFKAPAAAACLGFALLVQIGTNFANDYFDFIKGADTTERVGPRRAVASGLISPETMRMAMRLVFAAAFFVGLTLLRYGGWPLLVVGVLSIACGLAYTGGPWPLAYRGLGDVFVFIFFGLVAVGATFFVQAGYVSTDAIIAGAAIGALATNILLVNNYRDAETDAKAGKRTLVVRFGKSFARAQFAAAHGLALAAMLILSARLELPPKEMALFELIAAGLVAWQIQRLGRAQTPGELIKLLSVAGGYLALYALLLAGGLVWG